MANKLNSMRLLEKHGVPYDVIEYPDDMRDAEAIAQVIGVPEQQVYKTLVVQPVAGGKPMLVMMPSNSQLDLKKMAAACGEKKVSMAAHKDAEALTGLKVGGISALALTHKNWPVYIEAAAEHLDDILVSAGQRGLDLKLKAADLIQLLKAKPVYLGVSDHDG